MRLVSITAKNKFFGANANNCPKFEPLQSHMERVVTREFWAEGSTLLQQSFLSQKGYENVKELIEQNSRKRKLILNSPEEYVYGDGITARKQEYIGTEGIFHPNGEDKSLARHWLFSVLGTETLIPWQSRWGNGADLCYALVSVHPYEPCPYIKVDVLRIDEEWDTFLFEVSRNGLHKFKEFEQWLTNDHKVDDLEYVPYREHLAHNVLNHYSLGKNEIRKKDEHPEICNMYLPSGVERSQYGSKVSQFNKGEHFEDMSIGNGGVYNNVKFSLASADAYLPNVYLVVEIDCQEYLEHYLFKPSIYGFEEVRCFVRWLQENYPHKRPSSQCSWAKHMPHNALKEQSSYYHPGPRDYNKLRVRGHRRERERR